MRPQESLRLNDQCLLGAYVRGVIAFGVPNLRGWSYRLCTRAATTVIIHALVGAGPTLSWFRDFIFLWDSLPFFVRPRAAAPLWGGVMLCIVSGCP